jgi:predicted MFS family arabinose efflux permease
VAKRILVDLAPLRESRDFRLLFAGQLLSTLGSQLTVVAIPFQVFRETHSSLQVGAISMAQLIPLVVGSLVGGSAGDAMDRRTLMLAATVVSMATSGGLALNALSSHPSVIILYVVSAVAAGAIGFANPARSAALPAMVGRQHLVAALAFVQIILQLGTVIGPALSGLLIGAAGLPWVYGIDALSFVALFGFTLRLSPLPPAPGSRRPGWHALVEGVHFLRGRQPIQGAYLIDINAMVFGMPRALFPALAQSVFGGGASTLGLLYAAPGAGALVGAVTTGWVGGVRRRGWAVVVAVGVWGTSVAIFGFTHVLWLALALLAVAGWADVISAVLRNTIVQTSVTDEFRSRLSAFQMAVVQGGPRLGDFEAGGVAALTSTEISIVSGGIACVVGAVALALALPGFLGHRAEHVDQPNEPLPN